MARARNIKPGFFRNADLAELNFEVRLLFIGLWTLADRSGRLEDRHKQIKMELFPADSVDCDAMLAQLAGIQAIDRYEVEGKRYIQITNFEKHQNPHRDEKVSDIPDRSGSMVAAHAKPAKHCASTVQAPCEDDASTVAIGLIPDSLIPDPLTKTTAAIASAVSAPPKRAARKCPADFEVTSEMQEFAEQFRAVNWRLETEKLRDHTFKNPISDWSGAWRNWIRRSAEDAPNSRDSPALSFRERDELNAIARVHEMTGGLVSAKPSTPRRPDALQEVFDAQTAAKRNDRLAVRAASSPVRLLVVEQVGGD